MKKNPRLLMVISLLTISCVNLVFSYNRMSDFVRGITIGACVGLLIALIIILVKGRQPNQSGR